MTKILVADTETASLEGGVCDLGYIEVDAQFNFISSHESLIDPERTIGFAAMGIHNITNEMVADQPTLAEYVEVYGNPFASDDLIICGHNIKFDCDVLADILPAQYRIIDTFKLSRQLYPEAENHQLQTLRWMFGLEGGTSHRAMGDVVTALSLLRHIARQLNTDALGLEARMALPISMDNTMPFGKHRGDKLRDLPKSYVRWCLDQEGFDADLLEAFRAHFFPGK